MNCSSAFCCNLKSEDDLVKKKVYNGRRRLETGDYTSSSTVETRTYVLLHTIPVFCILYMCMLYSIHTVRVNAIFYLRFGSIVKHQEGYIILVLA